MTLFANKCAMSMSVLLRCKNSWSEQRSRYAFSRRLLLEFRRPSPSILFSHHVSQNDALQQQLTLSEEIRNSQELRLRVAHELDVLYPTCHWYASIDSSLTLLQAVTHSAADVALRQKVGAGDALRSIELRSLKLIFSDAR
jgi:hypothetical protein